MNTYGTVGMVPTVPYLRYLLRYQYCDTELPGKGKERGKMLARTDKEA